MFYPLSRKERVVFFHNLTSATLWFCCLARFLVLLPLVGRRFLPAGIADFFHVVSLFPLIGFFLVNGLVRTDYTSSDLWSFVCACRMVWVSYVVIFPHPKIAKHTSYSFLIFSWCLGNLIDSCYHAFRMKTRSSPKFLFILHYKHFYLTFPLAFISEFVLTFLSLAFVENPIHELVLEVATVLHFVLGYFLWRHLQERKRTKCDDYLEKRRLGTSATSGSQSSTGVSTSNDVPMTNLREPLRTPEITESPDPLETLEPPVSSSEAE